MIRRAAFALAVLTGTIFWANCDRVLGLHEIPPVAPSWNTFFAGCFQGPVTNPAGFGDLVLTVDAKAEDKRLLGGCLRLSRAGQSAEFGTLMGAVLDDRQQAEVTITPSSGVYTLRVQRTPSGDLDATVVDLSDKSGAPFMSASNLQRCSMPVDCSSGRVRMPFLPGGGAP